MKRGSALHIHWLTILSLDAPLVALAWQELFAKEWQTIIGTKHRLLIFVAVWLGYASDRWLDTLSLSQCLTRRHRFYARHRWTLLALWICVLAGSVYYAFETLSRHLLIRGLALATTSIVITFLIQRLKPSSSRAIGKSAIAAFLVVGSATIFTLPPLSSITFEHSISCISTFSLFALNCLLIHNWDHAIDQLQESSPRNRYTRSIWYVSCGTFAAIVICVISDSLIGIAALVSFLGLLLVETRAQTIPLETKRTLADIALLSPFLILLLA